MITIDVALQFVWRQHHDDIGPFGGIRHALDLDPLALRLLRRSRAFAQGDDNLLHTGIAEVQSMRMALAAIADDGDFLALDEVDISIPIIIDAHGFKASSFFSGLWPLGWVLCGSQAAVKTKVFYKFPRARSLGLVHMGSGPRVIAAIPVRDTSTRPMGRINSTN